MKTNNKFLCIYLPIKLGIGVDFHSFRAEYCCSLGCCIYDEEDVEEDEGDKDKFSIDEATTLLRGDSGGEGVTTLPSEN